MEHHPPAFTESEQFALDERSRMQLMWWALAFVTGAIIMLSLVVLGIPASLQELRALLAFAATVCVYAACVLCSGLTLFAWWGCVKFVNLPWLSVSCRLLGLRLRARDWLFLGACVLAGVALMTVGWAQESTWLPAIGVFLVTTATMVPVFVARPPAILFLSSSHHQSISFLARLDRNVRVPLYIASLIDGSNAYSAESRRITSYGGFRSRGDNWLKSVGVLASIAPIIILDARVPTPAVQQEAALLVADPLSHKTIVLLDANGRSPALDEIDRNGALLTRRGGALLPMSAVFEEIRKRTGPSGWQYQRYY